MTDEAHIAALEADLQALLDRPAPKHRVLFWDIETAPLLSHLWSLWGSFTPAVMVERESFMISWAAKWEDEDKVMSGVLTPEEALAQDDTRIVTELAELLREADRTVAHNGDRFDLPKTNNTLLLKGLDPLPPRQTIDTLTLARKSFRLASNKLDYLASVLGFGHKIQTDFDLWRRCYQGDPDALTEMLTYNRHDVVLLQQVYEELAPHARGLPRLVDGDGRRGKFCPTCGSAEVERDGWYRTNASTFPRYRCTECKRYSRTRKTYVPKKLELHPL